MKLPKIKILNEKNKLLRQRSAEVTFPLSDDDKKSIEDLLIYLKMSQDEKYIEKYDLRAGMGMAFVQIGKLKRIFVIASENEDGSFEEHVIINPKITSTSKELVYVSEGEGCLSVERPVDGIVPRYARINLDYNDIDGNIHSIRVREDISIAFQHEIDHLNGLLFVDKIDKKNPYKNKDNMREI
ncbi:MAG: peptide deformylase [bacterium]